MRSASLLSSRPRSAADIFARAPWIKRLAGGLDGEIDVGLVAFGDLANSPVAGLMVSNVLPETLRDPLVVDQNLGLLNWNLGGLRFG